MGHDHAEDKRGCGERVTMIVIAAYHERADDGGVQFEGIRLIKRDEQWPLLLPVPLRGGTTI